MGLVRKTSFKCTRTIVNNVECNQTRPKFPNPLRSLNRRVRAFSLLLNGYQIGKFWQEKRKVVFQRLNKGVRDFSLPFSESDQNARICINHGPL